MDFGASETFYDGCTFHSVTFLWLSLCGDLLVRLQFWNLANLQESFGFGSFVFHPCVCRGWTLRSVGSPVIAVFVFDIDVIPTIKRGEKVELAPSLCSLSLLLPLDLAREPRTPVGGIFTRCLHLISWAFSELSVWQIGLLLRTWNITLRSIVSHYENVIMFIQ